MKILLCYTVLLSLLLLSCRLNKVDSQHRRQGKWKVYYDENRKQLFYRGRYKDHRPVKNWKYCLPDGSVYLKEKYGKNDWVQTTYYYPNGLKRMEGFAQYIVMPDTIFYRWEGDWKKYDSTGFLYEIAYYKYGKFSWISKRFTKP